MYTLSVCTVICLVCQILAVLIILLGWPNKGKLKFIKFLSLFIFGLAVLFVPDFYTLIFTPFFKLTAYCLKWPDDHPELLLAGPLLVALLPIAGLYIGAILAALLIPCMFIVSFFFTPFLFLFYPIYYWSAEEKIDVAEYLAKDVDDILNFI